MVLKPCPFCGNEANFVNSHPSFSEDSNEWDIACSTLGCFLEYGADWFLPREKVAKMWNERGRSDD